jgi:hypothetical protein
MPPATRFAHATRAPYTSGCRCAACRKANTEYARKRAKAIIFHGKNNLVSADRARKHLFNLSRRGVGRRAVAAACDVSETVLGEIRVQRKTSIRRYTESRILAVTPEATLDRALIPAKQTWVQIQRLLREGFTKAELARRLGYKSPALQINRKRVTAANAARVDRFYRSIMAGDEEVAA